MVLITASKYLLLTEAIGKKPMLRTRFTSQSYFVLAAFLDLVAQKVIRMSKDRVRIDETVELPAYLSIFTKELTAALAKDDSLENALKPITSWDIANQIYDGIGHELLASNQVRRVVFQNNLKPHIIYEPTDSARSDAKGWLIENISTSSTDLAALNLFEIMSSMDALKWVINDQGQRAELVKQVEQNANAKDIHRIGATAAEVITQKRFWLDSWLS